MSTDFTETQPADRPNEEATQVTQAPQGIVVPVLQTDPSIEYVAGDNAYAWYTGTRALPQTIDDAERDFGLGIYDTMLLEPTLAASDDILRILALGEGLTLKPSVDKPDPRKATPEEQAEYDKAVQIKDWAVAMLDALPDPILDTMWDMLEAYAKGHRVAELVFDNVEGDDELKGTALVRIAVKPRETFVFVMDPFNRMKGIIAKVPGSSIVLRTGVTWDLRGIVNAIAPDKFWIMTFAPRNGLPTGRAALRPCYDSWRRKVSTKTEHAKAITQFAGGRLSTKTAKEAPAEIMAKKADGTIDKMSLQDGMIELLKQWLPGGVIAGPPGVEFVVHYPQSDGQVFELAFDRCDKEMVLAYIKVTRATQEAKHGSKADSGTAQDLLDRVVDYVQGKLCSTFKRQVLRKAVELRWGKAMVKYTPTPTLEGVDKPDFAGVASGIASLAGAGFIAEEQKPYYDGLLGAPERDPEDEQEDVEASPEGQEGQPGAKAPAGFPLRQGADGKSVDGQATGPSPADLREVDPQRAEAAARAKRAADKRLADRRPVGR